MERLRRRSEILGGTGRGIEQSGGDGGNGGGLKRMYKVIVM